MSYFAAAKATYKTYAKELAFLGIFFAVWLTVTNAAHHFWGLKLLPLFKQTFDSFHAWCHFILNALVFSWLTYFLGWLWYWLVWLCSLFLPVVPWRPRIIIPGLVTDLALLSLAFTRVFAATDLIVPRQVRDEAVAQMNSQSWDDIQRAEGPFWGLIHRFVENVNMGIWESIDVAQRILTYPIRGFPRWSIVVRRVLITLAGSVLFWGFIRLTGYVINVLAARRVPSPVMIVRRRFLKYFCVNLLAAVVAAAMFFVVNGWVADRFPN